MIVYGSTPCALCRAAARPDDALALQTAEGDSDLAACSSGSQSGDGTGPCAVQPSNLLLCESAA